MQMKLSKYNLHIFTQPSKLTPWHAVDVLSTICTFTLHRVRTGNGAVTSRIFVFSPFLLNGFPGYPKFTLGD